VDNPDVEVLQVDSPEQLGAPLPPWTYTNPELFELEYDAFFLRRWQFVGHVNEVPEPGDFMTADIGRDSVFVIRGKDNELRAFQNVCRHRGSRLLEEKGNCRGVIKCPYHGWTYKLDGSLLGVPMEDNFPDFDRSEYGLHEIQLDIFHGFVFVRVRGDGPGVAEEFAHTERYFELYGVEDYVPCMQTSVQVWDVNWKIAWDNYLENYHIPVGHPGLNRLLNVIDEYEELSSGVNFGAFKLKRKPSKVEAERKYQELFPHANKRIPEEIRGKWVQFGVTGYLGIDLYPELLDIFRLVPLGPDKTAVYAAYYGHADPTPEEEKLRELNLEINDPVNDEDRELCERVQKGVQTTDYEPGPLSSEESSLWFFHEMVRKLVPVTRLDNPPPVGQVAAENEQMLESKSQS
jgi:phenylpropionate dioxygenase-like ring-hydroxylating dioxygenase large terminal subunit